MSAPEYNELVEAELSGENKEVYLFRWLTTTLKYIKESPIPDLKAKQSDIEKQLIKIVSSPEPYPTPGCAFRNLVGKCLVEMYTRAETRTMFDVLQAFMKVAGDFKAPADRDGSKLAALSCVGGVMAVFGANASLSMWSVWVMSFMAEIATVTLKTVKASSSTLLRYQALVALEKSISTAKRAITDATTKGILKQCRNCLADKALPVQHAAANVIIAMYSHDDGAHPSTSDIETILNPCVKSLDTADQLTRLQKHKDRENADDDAITPSQAAEVQKAQLSPTEMLLLSNHFNKPHQSHEIRSPSNALSFVNGFTSQNMEDPAELQQHPLSPGVKCERELTLQELESLLRQHVYQCFSELGFSCIAESTQASLLQLTILVFAGPEAYRGTGLAVQAAIAGGYGYGAMSSEVVDFGRIGTRVNGDILLRKPILGACEHDPLSLCKAKFALNEYQPFESPPPATSVTDTAIELFAQLLPLWDLSSTVNFIQ
ncbi:hypothetical protein D9756_004483 [Leucocoprinus leucothites]|uniref:Uncharacterized protein n=1 Tax=Leucocoprinus leucothites TaxID=201217 RepID=A0A8H5G9V0_9AGAR|nr:hypothetical protein D9756_004483 [Leucoagaricus leucothites]